MSHAEYVVTEAGFGADLGAEKFMNIKCRKANIRPSLSVLVVTSQALKMHGGISPDKIAEPNRDALISGFRNMDKHIRNLQSFGQKVLVAFNRYSFDLDEEIEAVRQHCTTMGVVFSMNESYSIGGEGAIDLAEKAVDLIEENAAPIEFTYNDNDPIRLKVEKIAQKIYGAGSVVFSEKALRMLPKIDALNASHFPVCIAKTQYSFSDDKANEKENFEFHVNDLVINNGAEFIVAIAGSMMRMPGLPKEPQALKIDIVDGFVTGLS